MLFEADQRNEDILRYPAAADCTRQISALPEIIRGVRAHDEEIREFVETTS